MKILVITNDLPPRVGGIQYYVDQLCRGLSTAGDDVTVYGSAHDGDVAWDVVAPYRVVRERTKVLLPGPRTFRHSLRLVDRYEPDVIVFGAAFPLALMGSELRRRTGVPYVAFTHGLEVSAARAPGGRQALRLIGRNAAAITFVSHWCESLLRPRFGTGPRYELLSPAVDSAIFNSEVDGSEIRSRYGFGDDPVVVCVSRVVERKGQDQLVRGLGELRRRVPAARLLMVGGGPHLGAVRDLADRLGASEHVTFAGEVSESELPAHFAAGDVFAMPCRERRGGLEVEAFGIVFIQAGAVGRPVVAGDIGGVPDALHEGRTGLLVDGTNVDAITDAIAGLLADPRRAARMGAAGAEFVAEGYTWDRRTEELRKLLGDVVGSRAEASL